MSLRFIIIASLALTVSLTGFAAVILPAPRTTVHQLPQTKTTTTTSTIITNQPVGTATRQIITRQTTIQTRPLNTPNRLNTQQRLRSNTLFPYQQIR